MASVSFPRYNSVPNGVAGGGESFILHGGTAPLQTIMRMDLQAQKRTAVEAARKQQQAAQEMQDLQKLRTGIATDGFLPYHKELNNGRQQVFANMLAAYQNPALNRMQKQAQAAQTLTEYNGKVDWTKQVANRFKDIVQVSSKDKRYNPTAVDSALYTRLNDQQGNRLSMGQF